MLLFPLPQVEEEKFAELKLFNETSAEYVI